MGEACQLVNLGKTLAAALIHWEIIIPLLSYLLLTVSETQVSECSFFMSSVDAQPDSGRIMVLSHIMRKRTETVTGQL